MSFGISLVRNIGEAALPSNWYEMERDDLNAVNLGSSGIVFQWQVPPNTRSSSDAAFTEAGSGDASWAVAGSFYNGLRIASGSSLGVFSGLSNVKKYNIYATGSVTFSGSRVIGFVANDRPEQTVDLNNGGTSPNFTESAIFLDVVPVNGEITFGFRDVSGFSYCSAFYIEEVEFTDPVIAPTTNPPQGGEVFAFSGINYAAQPTGPMTFTQGTRIVSRAVTITDWNATDGSFNGVTNTPLPGIPTDNTSESPALLSDQDVTINLPDSGGE